MSDDRGSSRLAAWRLSRSGELPDNPSVFTQRVNSFVSGALPGGRYRTRGPVTFLVVRDESRVMPYVIARDTLPAGQAMRHIADAAGAVAEKTDGLPDLFPGPSDGEVTGRVTGMLVARPSVTAGKAVQAGADPGEMSRRLAAAMSPGSFAAITFRSPSRAEMRRVRAWFRHRLQSALPQHYVSDQSLVVAAFTAGADSRAGVRSLLSQVAASVPGFDIENRVVFPVSRGAQAAGIVTAGAGVLAGSELGFHAPLPLAAIAAAAPVVYGAGSMFGWLPPGRRSRFPGEGSAVFPQPARRAFPPSQPRQESTRTTRGRDGMVTSAIVREKQGDYPLARSTFAVSPSMIAGLIAPHAGAVSGESRTSQREVPAPMRDRIGPGIGTVTSATGRGDGALAHLPVKVEEGSVFVTGRQGSGKSALLYAVYGWFCRDRVAPSGVPGSTGARNSLVVFESAGPGALDWVKWARAMGDEVTLVELADPASAVIDMLNIPGLDNRERALAFTNALLYCFGADAIGNRSFDTLKQAIEAGLAVTPEIIAATESLKDKADEVFAGSPLYYAHILLGRFGDAAGKELADALAAAALQDPGNQVLKSASEALDPLYGQRTMAQRRDFVDPPRNKIGPLLDSGTWFAPRSGREQVPWHEIIGGHRNVVLNMGSSSDGSGMVADDSVTTMMLSLLMHTMHREIRRSCAGWQADSRAVTVFSDELSQITAGGESVIAWGLDQGRKYGLRQLLATQRAEQLTETLRTCMLSFPNAVYLQQANAQVRDQIAHQLIQLDPEMTAETVARLEPYTAIVTATVRGSSLPPVTVRIPYWSGDLAGFPEAQGWQRTAAPIPAVPEKEPDEPGGQSGNIPEVPQENEDAGW